MDTVGIFTVAIIGQLEMMCLEGNLLLNHSDGLSRGQWPASLVHVYYISASIQEKKPVFGNPKP